MYSLSTMKTLYRNITVFDSISIDTLLRLGIVAITP